MAKDYFSDLGEDSRTKSSPSENTSEAVRPDSSAAPGGEKSIRNIMVSPRRTALTSQRVVSQDVRTQPRGNRGFKMMRSRLFLWSGAAMSAVVLLGIAFMMFWSSTTVDVTPRTHQITFDPSTQFVAYPESNPVGDGIIFTTKIFEVQDSQTVPASGVEKAEDRASGVITVFNSYSATPVRLIKNTRFESPQGLVFRIPASIEVPGKKGATPGQITVTVFADQPGTNYNIGPGRFSIPGLKSTADMYNGVYAQSSEAFAGGFVGERPAVSQSALESARAEIRSRLESKIRESIASTQEGFAFSGLAKVQYESLPTVPDPAGGARVTEKGFVLLPVFPSDTFAHALALAVSADAEDSKVTLNPQGELKAQISGTMPNDLNSSPITFNLSGTALIVWDVDAQALREALAGKEQGAFKPIVATFLGIKDAKARIAPFWSSNFPSDPSDITIVVANPVKAE